MINNKCLIAFRPAGSKGWYFSEVLQLMDFELEYAFLFFLIEQGVLSERILAEDSYLGFSDLILDNNKSGIVPIRLSPNLPRKPLTKAELRIFAALNDYYTIYWVTRRGKLFYSNQNTYDMYLKRDEIDSSIGIWQDRGCSCYKNLTG
ncbi:MAG TPA: hypothetical protein PLF50_01895 [Candidatus Cloacimonadota bacterium]|nr:hypothetical protein [Candidatus Cloacimonadota bacterium]